MPRAKTTVDVFNAIGEPRRRQIIDLLARGREMAVGALVVAVGLPQPAISKHLSVLRKVGIVSMKKEGQQRMYRLEPRALRPVHDWVAQYEQFWTQKLDRIKERAERRAREKQRS
jgi:DNA-binding transcriptional ArsR family regulator